MSKIYIRTLWPDDKRALWCNHDQREGLRKELNDLGFHVLTGASDSLEVYAIDYSDPWDIALAKKALDKFQKSWYTLIRREKEITK